MSCLDREFFAISAMKRKAAQADIHLVRVEVHVPPDRCNRGHAMIFHLNALEHRPCEENLAISCQSRHRSQTTTVIVSIEQASRQVAFTEPTTVLKTVEPAVSYELHTVQKIQNRSDIEFFCLRIVVCSAAHMHLCLFWCVCVQHCY